MLDKYEINLEYHLNGAKKATVSKDMENEDYTINALFSNANRLFLNITPKAGNTLTIDRFYVKYHYDYLPRFKQFQRIFAGGYQSKSMAREYFPDESQSTFNKKNVSRNMGDYDFADISKKKWGNFRSTSYTYIRNNDDIELFASMNEASGFTTFYVDVPGKEFRISKDLEGLEIADTTEILNVIRYQDEYNAAFDRWFKDLHIPAPKTNHTTGYTTWYNYFDKINESIVLRDLESIASLDQEVDIFQIDSGYQTNIGDWTTFNTKKFPGMDSIADAIHEKKMLAGLWLAPFACSAKSHTFKNHRDWFVTDEKGKPFKAGSKWGGFYTLDIYNDEVREHLRETFDTILNTWGYDMVKLDELYQVAIIPYNGKTRGEIMTDAINLLRELCGSKLILAGATPLFPAFGKVDFCRIGPDMGLKWKGNKNGCLELGTTKNAIENSIFRRHLDGRAFVNDPDVFLLRGKNIKLNKDQRCVVASINRAFGNVVFTSDDVSTYNKDWQLAMLDNLFTHNKIKIMGAEYVTSNIIHVKYFDNNTPTLITIDMKNGVMLKQEVDESELNVASVDDALTHREGADYANSVDDSFNNYDDFDFDRELTDEEKAEIEAAKEAKEQKIQDMVAKKLAEREAKKEEARKAREEEIEKKRAEVEAKNAEIRAKNAEIKARMEAAAKAKEEAEAAARAKAEAEAKAKAEAEAAAKAKGGMSRPVAPPKAKPVPKTAETADTADTATPNEEPKTAETAKEEPTQAE